MDTPPDVEIERISSAEIVESIANLLSRFADPTSAALGLKVNRDMVFEKTGVMYNLEALERHGVIVFGFFIPGFDKATGKEMDALLKIDFHVERFHADPQLYVTNMLKTMGRTVGGMIAPHKSVTERLSEAANETLH